MDKTIEMLDEYIKKCDDVVRSSKFLMTFDVKSRTCKYSSRWDHATKGITIGRSLQLAIELNKVSYVVLNEDRKSIVRVSSTHTNQYHLLELIVKPNI